jgi:hypothetical protein
LRVRRVRGSHSIAARAVYWASGLPAPLLASNGADDPDHQLEKHIQIPVTQAASGTASLASFLIIGIMCDMNLKVSNRLAEEANENRLAPVNSM